MISRRHGVQALLFSTTYAVLLRLEIGCRRQLSAQPSVASRIVLVSELLFDSSSAVLEVWWTASSRRSAWEALMGLMMETKQKCLAHAVACCVGVDVTRPHHQMPNLAFGLHASLRRCDFLALRRPGALLSPNTIFVRTLSSDFGGTLGRFQDLWILSGCPPWWRAAW